MSVKLSIIVPTHNSEKFIRECIESIMNQTYKNLEIICVDSSKDSTLSVLRVYAEIDKRIQIIQDANGSYGHKINVGIQQSTGDYIGIVESDDLILPNMYTDMLAKLGENSVDFIKSNAMHFGTINGRRVFCAEKKLFLDDYYDRVINLDNCRDIAIGGRPTIWTALYRRDFLLENQIWLNETPGASYQDTAFAILVGFVAKNCIFDRNTYYCYRRDNENSSVLSKDKIDYVRLEYEYVDNYLKSHNLYTEEVAKLLRKRKLITYDWNCMRLSDEFAKIFIESISREMNEYEETEIARYTENEKRIYGLLTGDKTLQEYRSNIIEVNGQVKQIINAFCENTKYVLVGAGKIGQRILELQEYLGNKSVVAIADNGKNIVGNIIKQYEVIGVETAVEQFPNCSYIIANKIHATEIEEQLINLGVPSEKIMCIKAFWGGDSLMTRCIEYCKETGT